MNSTSIAHRSSMRGLRKCTSCGRYNGTRALMCRNQQCPESNVKRAPKPKVPSATEVALLAVQLQTKGESHLYSVANREKNSNLRSFVQITDRTISSDEDGCIISRNAICFVDTCKYDSHDLNISCKHIKWALDGSAHAQVTPLLGDVWNRMRCPADELARNRIWTNYQAAIGETPMVQQINSHTFAVACEVSAAFPAGRLHVGIARPTKQTAHHIPGFVCLCKEARNGMVQSQIAPSKLDACDHICLVIAAIKSCPKLSMVFNRELLEYASCFQEIDLTRFDDQEYDDQPLENCLPNTDDFIKFSEDILNDSCTSNVSLDSSDNLVTPSHNIHDRFILTDEPLGDCPTLIGLDSIKIVNDPMANDLHNLELIDCQIELMDQFKLTDHIDLSSNDIHLDEADDLFGSAIVDLSSLGMDLKLDPIPDVEKTTLKNTTNGKVHKRVDVVACRKKRIPRFDPSVEVSETLLFDQWLDSVVERINNCMDFNENGSPEPLVFSVSHGFFNTLNKRFSKGLKRRLPLVSTVDLGSRTGLSRFSWTFSNSDMIRSIFRTNSSTIKSERLFRKCNNGRYKLISPEKHNHLVPNDSSNVRLIQPTKYSTVLKLKSATSPGEASVFTIEWTPNVLPISRFGEMRLLFQFCHRKNNRIIEFESK